MTEKNTKAWIFTHTNKRIYLLDLKPADIEIYDIAHALSNLCRYTGHSSSFYSVAQHSVICSSLLGGLEKKQALLHDAAEAYIGDMSAPLRSLPGMEFFNTLEEKISKVVFEKFAVPYPPALEVGVIDKQVLKREMQYFGFPNVPDHHCVLSINTPVNPLPPEDAEALFLGTFKRIFS